LQGEHGDRYVAGKLQLLTSQRHGLLDLKQGRLLTATRDVLVERLERLGLGLKFAETILEGA